ncbi:LysR family transcriptional regulator [Natronohydrobacter thiooxidans]|uniref:LysR family transcriptional regulator n=1 Tax=Natronohydrobacter thiooxidans TaxID=87172 RepID=UPI0008FF18B3|nr:LysR family transcriptional regulator [Natronohydrobacter thiooxidans]
MELRHLRAFRAVMQTGSTVDAAQALGISQPSVSRLLAEFEDATGETLFIRANGKLSARETAVSLLAGVERALAEVENLRARSEGSVVTLRFAAPAGVVTRIFAPALRRLQGDHPGVKVVAEIMSYYDIMGAVASGRVDLGFVKAPVAHPALDLTDLVEVGTDVVMPQTHPLAGRASITPQDLDRERLILLGRNRPFRVQLEQIFESARVRPEIMIETQAVSAACSFVREGLGITIANALLARAEAGEDLICVPFAKSPRHRFQLARLQRPARPKTMQIFANHVRDVVQELLGSDQPLDALDHR